MSRESEPGRRVGIREPQKRLREGEIRGGQTGEIGASRAQEGIFITGDSEINSSENHNQNNFPVFLN